MSATHCTPAHLLHIAAQLGSRPFCSRSAAITHRCRFKIASSCTTSHCVQQHTAGVAEARELPAERQRTPVGSCICSPQPGMADLDEEFARFTAELVSVEAAVAASDPAAAAEDAAAPPPLLPPPVPPPAAAASVGATLAKPPAAAPPPLVPPPLVPPPVLPPPVIAAPPAPVIAAPPVPAAAAAAAAASAAPAYAQPPPYGMPPPPGFGGPWGGPPGGAGGAPADAETLRRLKEELVQQKQAAGGNLGSGGGRFGAGGGGNLRPGGGAAGAAAGGSSAKAAKAKERVVLREAAGVRWKDASLAEWPDNDFRIFVGDIGNEVNDELLAKAFSRYPSFAKAKVIRDKRTNKSKGYGIVSLLDGNDFAKALKEMNGKYIGNRPCKLSKSTWNERASAPPPKGQKRRADVPLGPDGKPLAPTGPKAKYHIPILRNP